MLINICYHLGGALGIAQEISRYVLGRAIEVSAIESLLCTL